MGVKIQFIICPVNTVVKNFILYVRIPVLFWSFLVIFEFNLSLYQSADKWRQRLVDDCGQPLDLDVCLGPTTYFGCPHSCLCLSLQHCLLQEQLWFKRPEFPLHRLHHRTLHATARDWIVYMTHRSILAGEPDVLHYLTSCSSDICFNKHHTQFYLLF